MIGLATLGDGWADFVDALVRSGTTLGGCSWVLKTSLSSFTVS